MRTNPPGVWRCTVLLVLLPVYLAGCATPAPEPLTDAFSSSNLRTTDPQEIKQALYQQLDLWRCTPYRVGGMDGNGFDCSGLAYVLYRDMFDKRLPRTTEEQVKVGQSVSRAGLAPGDLVFFKTGVFQKHVGIYIEDGLFLHASRSHGVRMSSLGDGYWRKRYWKARRPGSI